MLFERKEIGDEYFLRALCHLKHRRISPTPKELARYFDCSLSMVREKIQDLRGRGRIKNEQSEAVDYTVVDNENRKKSLCSSEGED